MVKMGFNRYMVVGGPAGVLDAYPTYQAFPARSNATEGSAWIELPAGKGIRSPVGKVEPPSEEKEYLTLEWVTSILPTKTRFGLIGLTATLGSESLTFASLG